MTMTAAPSNIYVRPASIADLDVLTPLFDAYRQFYRKPPDLELARQFLFERFQHNESTILLALQQHGSASGFAQMFPSFSSGVAAPILILNDLFVVSELRRHGVARLLLHAAAEFGKAVGAARLTLSTEVMNTAARTLYEAEGWQLQTDYCVYNLPLTR